MYMYMEIYTIHILNLKSDHVFFYFFYLVRCVQCFNSVDLDRNAPSGQICIACQFVCNTTLVIVKYEQM